MIMRRAAAAAGHMCIRVVIMLLLLCMLLLFGTTSFALVDIPTTTTTAGIVCVCVLVAAADFAGIHQISALGVEQHTAARVGSVAVGVGAAVGCVVDIGAASSAPIFVIRHMNPCRCGLLCWFGNGMCIHMCRHCGRGGFVQLTRRHVHCCLGDTSVLLLARLQFRMIATDYLDLGGHGHSIRITIMILLQFGFQFLQPHIGPLPLFPLTLFLFQTFGLGLLFGQFGHDLHLIFILLVSVVVVVVVDVHVYVYVSWNVILWHCCCCRYSSVVVVVVVAIIVMMMIPVHKTFLC
mmetsp:Transcript_22441/g.34424  ORF Transcript_22441/g.34424 Transcript_22441/m.34424 type:complete len:293 (+) Transcript_22441:572-1450(+)